MAFRRIEISDERAQRALKLKSRLKEKHDLDEAKPNFVLSMLLRGLSLRVDIAGMLSLAGPELSAHSAITLSGPLETVGESLFASPGSTLLWKGYVVCGSTACGDTFFFDTKKLDIDGWPQVVLLSHEESYFWRSRKRISAIAKVVATDYLDFIDQFLADSVDDLCFYFDDIKDGEQGVAVKPDLTGG